MDSNKVGTFRLTKHLFCVKWKQGFFSILAFNLVSIPDYNFTIESKKIIGDVNYS